LSEPRGVPSHGRQAAAFAAWSRLKGLRPRPLDLGRTALLRTARREQLGDANWLAGLIGELGLNDEALDEYPEHLHPQCGQGLRIWQYPNQLAPYLVDLAGLRIASYLELGVRHGGTFVATVEYLNRFHPLASAVAVDVIPCPSLAEYARDNPRAELWQVDTRSAELARRLDEHGPFDLALVDSLHEEEHCRGDFLTLRERARIIAFHDVTSDRYPGVGRVWSEVKAGGDHACREYVAQYQGVAGRCMGLGVAVRTDRRHGGGTAGERAGEGPR
jgi:hypothetical protein